jgi:hypothetical protein
VSFANAVLLTEPTLILLGQTSSPIEFVQPSKFDGLCPPLSSLEQLPRGKGKGGSASKGSGSTLT